MKKLIIKIGLLVFAGVILAPVKISAQAGVGPAPYCMPAYGQIPCNQPNPSNNAGNFINDFIHSFNTTGASTNITTNNTGCNTQNLGGQVNYFYFPDIVTACPGTNITCNFMSGNTFPQGWTCFVDWNSDNVFQLTERVCSSPGVPPAATWDTQNFTVPAAQANGTYRMRVRCAYWTNGNTIDPCVYYTYGETHDYKLKVGGTTLTVTANSNSPVCAGQPLNLFATYTGTSVPTFTWTGPNGFTSNLQNPTVLNAQTIASGTYTVLASGGCGTGSAVVTAVVNPTPTIVATGNSPVCAGNTILLNANGGSNYNWNGPNGFTSGAQNPSILNATLTMSGAYNVTVTTAQGCTNTAIVNMTVLAKPQPTITSNSPICAGTQLNLFGTGGTTYNWTGPNGFNSTAQNPSIAGTSTLASGTYSLIATVGTCTNIVTANITVNALPNPTITTNSPVCAGKMITFTGSGGNSYSWSGPNGFSSASQNTLIASATAANAGTYSLIATSAQGCTNIATAFVAVNPLPVVGVNNPLVCLNQSINLTANGGATYSWSGPLGYTSLLQSPTILNAQLNMSGGYTVTVTSAAGCTQTAVSNVTVITLPNPLITSNSPVCAGNSLNLSGSGGATYNWSGPNGFTSATQNPTLTNVSVAAGGIYTLVVTAGTCSNITTASITINALPTPSITSNSPVCAGNPINFTGAGGTIYSWTGPSVFTSASQNTGIATASIANQGTYTLTVTDTKGCINKVTAFVTVNPLPVIVVNNPLVCLNQNINLSSSGGATYSWSGPNGYTSNTQNPTITNAALNMTGGYTVTVTSTAGCTQTAVANLTVITLPNPLITSNSPVCFGGVLNLFGTGGTGYAWVGPNGFFSAAQNPTITNVNLNANGTYSLIVTAGTCSNSTVGSVTINALPVPVIQSNSPVCLNNPIALSGSGGVSYQWNGPGGFNLASQTGTIANSLLTHSGNWTLTVTDANGCVNKVTQFVTVNPLPVIAAAGSTVCATNNLLLSANGGTAYTWNGPNGFSSTTQNPVINNSSVPMSGTYTVTVTNNNGCVSTSVTVAKVNSIPSVTMSGNGPICDNQDLKVGIGTDSGVQFNWTGPNGFTSTSQNPVLTGVSLSAGGTYNVVVKDNIGCTNTGSISVPVNPLPSGNITSSGNKGCMPHCMTFSCQTSSTIQFYNWAFGDGNANSGTTTNNCYSAEGVYDATVTITDNNGCSSIATMTTEVYPLPIADFNYAPYKPIVNNADITFTDASYGTPIVKWDWFFKNQPKPYSKEKNPVYIYDEAGIYAVVLIVTSDHGCTDTIIQTVTVGEDYGIYVPNVFSPNEDGLNDTFQPKGYGITWYEFRVFDRWGQEMLFTNDFNQGWDGMFKGKLCKEDTYTWSIVLHNVFGKSHELTGNVTLIK